MEQQIKLSPDSPGVQAQLRMTQDIIRRMGENSRTCKSWCVGFFAGITVLSATLGPPNAIWTLLIPLPALMLLDAYYLAHEREIHETHRKFLTGLHSGELTLRDLYEPGTGQKGMEMGILRALKSFSVYGFYGPLAALGAALGAMLYATSA